MNIWRHKKTGNLYVIIGECKIETDWMDGIKYISIHDPDREEIIRPKAQFFDGRFERLNSMEYRDGSVILKSSEEFLMAQFDHGGGCPCGLHKECNCEGWQSPRSIQGQVWDWAFEEFGVNNILTLAIRGNKEMSELLQEIQTGGKSSKEIAVECADVAFFLLQICEANGHEMMDLVAEKLEINKKRKWARAADGSFQHVEEKE